MFSHVVVGSNDLAKSKAFYDAVFTAIGGKPGRIWARALPIATRAPISWSSIPINGEPATYANGGTIGFSMDSARAGRCLARGRRRRRRHHCEDPPGVRDLGFAKLYLAYLRDPDGNKLCAMRFGSVRNNRHETDEPAPRLQRSGQGPRIL